MRFRWLELTNGMMMADAMAGKAKMNPRLSFQQGIQALDAINED